MSYCREHLLWQIEKVIDGADDKAVRVLKDSGAQTSLKCLYPDAPAHPAAFEVTYWAATKGRNLPQK